MQVLKNDNKRGATHVTPSNLNEPDVIIVGSGAGGAMAAYVLTLAGISCVMLEAGRDYDQASEVNMFPDMQAAPLRGMPSPDKPFGYFDATVDGGWNVPGEPFTVAEGSRFEWWRSRMLGGRTNHWGRHVPRYGPYDFKPFSRDGLGVDWPMAYDDLAPWYDRTERLVGVFGANSGLENHPSSPPGILHKPPKPRIPEMLIQAAAANLGIPCVPSHYAILTRDMPDPAAPRSACYNATPCGNGCSIGAAFSTTTSLLPMAKATGRLRIVTQAMVSKVNMDAKGRAEGVVYIDRVTGQSHSIKARLVVLAASACETARILLNSKDEERPRGLANSSDQVGRNLMDTVGTWCGGVIPGLEGRPIYNEEGTSNAHLYIPFWLYKAQAAGQLDFPRGYHFEIEGRFGLPGPWSSGDDLPPTYGKGLTQALRAKMGNRVGFSLRGEMIPNAGTYAEVDPHVKDKFGIPVLKFHWQWSKHEINMADHGLKTARAIIERMGGSVVNPGDTGESSIRNGGSIIHEVGTARMGADPATSVTNAYNQTWDVNNLFITDGAVLASNPHKNPTLTIMALAWRACDQIARRLKRGEFA